MFANTPTALPFRDRLTAQPSWPCGIPAEALFREVPSMTDLDSRYLILFVGSQVISGWSGLSVTGVVSPVAGHLNAANFASHSVPGSAAHLSGSLIDAPLVVAGVVGVAVGVLVGVV